MQLSEAQTVCMNHNFDFLTVPVHLLVDIHVLLLYIREASNLCLGDVI